jgi:hypothetical protein
MPNTEQRAEAFDAVSSELDYQAQTWPDQSPEDVLSVGEEILVMEEYLLKA